MDSSKNKLCHGTQVTAFSKHFEQGISATFVHLTVVGTAAKKCSVELEESVKGQNLELTTDWIRVL